MTYGKYSCDHDRQEDVVHSCPVGRNGSSSLVALQLFDVINIAADLANNFVGVIASEILG